MTRMIHMRPPVRPLIAEDSGTVCHVWWKNGAIVDTVGNAWVANGSIPMVPRSGKTPAGAGPFSDVNFYSLGTGNDVLDFAGDFSICVVYSAVSRANNPVLVSNGLSTTDGYYLQLLSTGNVVAEVKPTILNAAHGITNGVLSVTCFGVGGGLVRSKSNLGALAQAATGARTQATTRTAKLGRYDAINLSFNGYLYEIWASTTTATDALFTDIANRVKSRAGVTAW